MKAFISPVAVAAAVFVVLILLVLGSGLTQQRQAPSLPLQGRELEVLNKLTVAQRKRIFFAILQPMVARANARVLADRARLKSCIDQLQRGDTLARSDRDWLVALADRYLPAPAQPSSAARPADGGTIVVDEQAQVQMFSAVLAPGQGVSLRAELLRRVDAVPQQLALVQAAKESGWGRSRFVREANNLFGQWCYVPGCGLVPKRRNADARHEVASFGSLEHAVQAYLFNINTHASYADFRDLRMRARAAGQPLLARELTAGLLRYSERGADYVAEVNGMLRSNQQLLPAAGTI